MNDKGLRCLLSFLLINGWLLHSIPSFAETVAAGRLEAIPEGHFAQVKHIFDQRFETVCVVQPYAQRIQYRKDIDDIVNEYLETKKYRADENYWSVALVSGAQVILTRFNRSPSLDLLSPSEYSNIGPIKAIDFSASICAPYQSGEFKKVYFSNRSYVVLGERK